MSAHRTTVCVTNPEGLHARPANRVAQLANRYEAQIWLVRDGIRINAKSLLGILTLACPSGTELLVEAEGPDAAEAVAAMEVLFASGPNPDKEPE
ncbi:MAG: HPr family phosphocarrier protein [Candidatus Dadabacteria bacterium]|nr:MAG: HPr family phosphocarrier protein [Candidatus Dadabacteria bacterium]